VFVVALSTNNLRLSASEIPKRDTTEMRLCREFTDKIFQILGLEITATWCSLLASREADIQLGILAAVTVLDDLYPLVVVEPFPYKTFWYGITPAVVIELHKQGIKLGRLDHLLHVKVLVASWALRRTGDGDSFIEFAKSVDHSDVRTIGCQLSADTWLK
jgi:hypothetical protein